MEYKELSQNEKVNIQEILWDYSNWLHKHGYIDSDYYCEEPLAVDGFIKSLG